MKIFVIGSNQVNDRKDVFRSLDDSRFHITDVFTAVPNKVTYYAEQWAMFEMLNLKRLPHNKVPKFVDGVIMIWESQENLPEELINQVNGLKIPFEIHLV